MHELGLLVALPDTASSVSLPRHAAPLVLPSLHTSSCVPTLVLGDQTASNGMSQHMAMQGDKEQRRARNRVLSALRPVQVEALSQVQAHILV